MPKPDQDAVDRITSEWNLVRPDLDTSPIHIIGRISRLSRLVDRRLAENFAKHGIENWMYDVLATLRRIGEPHEMTAGELVAQSMVTTGAITNRIDRLTKLELVERAADPTDRRKVLVRLTPRGKDLVDEIVGGHMGVEHEILQDLDQQDLSNLADSLRSILLGMGDTA